MNRLKDYISQYYQQKGYNCAETVLHAANDAWGLDLHPMVFTAMGGFGGGMGSRNVCGAISGGIAAMGYLYVQETGHKSPLMMAKTRLLMQLVKERLGDEKCSYLNPRFHTKEARCMPTIELICDIIDEVVETELHIPLKV